MQRVLSYAGWSSNTPDAAPQVDAEANDDARTKALISAAEALASTSGSDDRPTLLPERIAVIITVKTAAQSSTKSFTKFPPELIPHENQEK